ncbi:MAG: MarR family transcriptional regulator [archaeon]|nr:MarR family transcriptional regulator [archaeon]
MLYLTGSGYRIIDNPIQMRIANALEGGCCRFTDIANVTGLPRSTISTSITKMEKDGLVRRDDPDRKGNGGSFSIAGSLLVRTEEPSSTSSDPFSILGQEVSGHDLYLRYIIGQLLNVVGSNGLSLNPLIRETLEWIGVSGCDLLNPASVDEGVDNLTELFRKSGIATIEVVGRMPLKLRITFGHATVNIETLLHGAGILCGAYLGRIPSFNVPLVVGDVEPDGQDGGVVRLDLCRPSSRTNHHATEYGLEHDPVFRIYWNGRRFIPIHKGLDVSVMDHLLRNDGTSMKTLSEQLSVPLSTISDCVHNLVGLGLISARRAQRGGGRFGRNPSGCRADIRCRQRIQTLR